MVKQLDLSRFIIFDGGVGKYDNDTETVHFSMSKGVWPEIKYYFFDELKGFNSFTFEAKINNAPTLSLVLYSQNMRAISDSAQIMGKRDCKQGEWQTYTWYFREKPNWVTPPSAKYIDFDKGFCLGFVCNAKFGQFDIDIRNARFTDQKGYDSESLEIEEFLKTHKQGSLKDKKALIWTSGYSNKKNYGCTVQGVIEAFDYYEKLKGYSGLVMDFIDTPATCFRDTLFTPEPLDENVLNQTVKAYKSWDWKQYNHNFIRTDIVGMVRFKDENGNGMLLDWFDDDLFYNHIYPKTEKFGKALNEMGISFMFDNEAYDTEPYDYYKNYSKTGRTLEEYKDKVFLRGKEFATAYAKFNPNGTIMITHGNWVVKLGDDDWYALMPSFLDGMLVADTNLKIIDGYEKGYKFFDQKSISTGVYDCTIKTPRFSRNPKLYKQRMHYGFATWLRTDFLDREHFAEIIINALRDSEEYVWIYTEASPIQREDVQNHFYYAGQKIIEQTNKEQKGKGNE